MSYEEAYGRKLNRVLSLEDIEHYIRYRRDFVIPVYDHVEHGHLSDILTSLEQISED